MEFYYKFPVILSTAGGYTTNYLIFIKLLKIAAADSGKKRGNVEWENYVLYPGWQGNDEYKPVKK